MKFLAKNWIWIVVPLVIAAVAAAVVFGLLSGEPEEAFTYPL
ncbi:MAG: hypothetical protein AAF726_13925 [Planctomycetota bacterium]